MRAPSSENAGTMSTVKPCVRPAASRKAGEPARPLPKWKSKPTTTPATAKRSIRILRTKSSAGERRERRVEPHHDHAVEAGAGEQAQLGGLVAQPEHRLVRPKHRARMRLEGEHRGLAGELAPARQRDVDDGAVAAVHPLEIADRHHGAVERMVGRRRGAARDRRVRR